MKLTLIAPMLLEEEVVDRLLENDEGLEFTSGTIYAHASGQERLSLVEQVTGRKRRVRFEIIGEAAQVESLLAALKEDLRHSGIHFFLQTLDARGSF